jgi:hypothetical protein
MNGTKLIRDHHLLTRNLKLNGNYLSNDGGDEGISIADNGDVTIASAGTTTHTLEIDSTALTTGTALKVDVDDSLTSASTKKLASIDYDKSGVTPATNLSKTTGLHISLADGSTNHADSFVQMIGSHIYIDSANAQGTIIQTGLILEVAKDEVGDASTTTGLDMVVMDGGIDIKLKSSADAEDYFSISTTASGATTIATVDSDDAEAAHLTLDIQGDTIFKGDIADGTSTEVARIDSSASSLLMASGKRIEFNNTSNFIYGASDLFMTGGRHLFLSAAGGDVVIDASGANITLQDDGSTYTPSAASDATTKAYVDTNVYHFIKCGFSTTSTLKLYIPLAASESLGETTSPTGLADSLVMICPFDGSLETIWARATGTPGDTDIGFHLSTTDNEVPSISPTQTVTVDMAVDDTSYEFDFAGAISPANTFSQGNTIMFSIDPTARMLDIHFMIVLKFDVTT